MIETYKLSSAESKEFTRLFESIAGNLDITETQFNNLVTSYKAVGKYLEEDSFFEGYHPVITHQGSLRLGTIIQPIDEDGDLDVDLVFRLIGKKWSWTQKDIKDAVGARLYNHKTYSSMLAPEGRRNWTIKYRDNADNPKERYHMDILPCVADDEFEGRLSRMSAAAYIHSDIDKLSIRITDKKRPGYETSIKIDDWLKSNPDGYALWFASRCKLDTNKREMLTESIIPIDKKGTRSILQKIVQILKRHRDCMFADSTDDKLAPISCIITTLAAKAYRGESDLFEGLINVVSNIELYISKDKDGNDAVWNPVNNEENFADKWPSHPERRLAFYKWLKQVKEDLANLSQAKGPELHKMVSKLFGQKLSESVVSEITEQTHNEVSKNALKVSSAAMLGSVGKTINAANTFYGKK